MPASKGDLLAHFKHLQRAIDDAGAEAILSFANFSVFIRRETQDCVLYPQFLAVVDNVKHYTQTFSSNVRQFIGWLPYYNKRWEMARDKLAFKKFALSNGLNTPALALDPDAEIKDVIIKRTVSSFGAQIKGPFNTSSKASLDRDQGEFYERFVRGKIAKIWYWDSMPVCMELDTMPFLVGDGTSTIRELLQKRIKAQKSPQVSAEREAETRELVFARAGELLAYFGQGLDTVLAHGKRQLIEFRYASDLHLPAYRRVIDLRASVPEALDNQLLNIGEVLWNAIPDRQRGGTVFTVDAIVDSEQRVWVLEMNSNPYVHPLVYPLMIPTLFGNNAKVRSAPTLQ